MFSHSLRSEKNYRATTKGQNRFGTFSTLFHTFLHFFRFFPQDFLKIQSFLLENK